MRQWARLVLCRVWCSCQKNRPPCPSQLERLVWFRRTGSQKFLLLPLSWQRPWRQGQRARSRWFVALLYRMVWRFRHLFLVGHCDGTAHKSMRRIQLSKLKQPVRTVCRSLETEEGLRVHAIWMAGPSYWLAFASLRQCSRDLCEDTWYERNPDCVGCDSDCRSVEWARDLT